MANIRFVLLNQSDPPVPNEIPIGTGFFYDFVGNTAGHTIVVAAGAGAEGVVVGTDVRLPGASTDYTYTRNGTKLEVTDADDVLVLEIAASTGTASALHFTDGVAEVIANIAENAVYIGNVPLADQQSIDGSETAVDVQLPDDQFDSEGPVIGPERSFSIQENSPPGTVLGTVQATDNVAVVGFELFSDDADGYFVIAPDGQLTVTEVGTDAIDFEGEVATYNLYVMANDAAGNYSETADITVVVTNDPTDDQFDSEGPVIGPERSFSIQENSPPGTVLGTVQATDNVAVVGFELFSDDADGYFVIAPDGQLTVTEVGTDAIDFEGEVATYNLYVMANDAAGNYSETADITVVVTNDPTDDQPAALEEVEIDNQGGLGAPFRLDAAEGAYRFIDTLAVANNVEIEGFGLDDQIVLAGVALSDVGFKTESGNTVFEMDDGAGKVSRITLLGVATDGFDIEGFNADEQYGDLLIS